jgi:hypothetical protein
VRGLGGGWEGAGRGRERLGDGWEVGWEGLGGTGRGLGGGRSFFLYFSSSLISARLHTKT